MTAESSTTTPLDTSLDTPLDTSLDTSAAAGVPARAVAENAVAWDAHTAAEFVTADVDATMATMTEDPTVVHVATSVGATGRDAVSEFYATWFIGRQAGDLALDLVSRTVTAERVVDELVVSFTHDVEVPWILPGVPPTGRSVVVPMVTVIGMRDGRVATEHIYWDQASVLVQVGLLEPDGLPVVGAGQADLVRPGADAARFNALLA